MPAIASVTRFCGKPTLRNVCRSSRLPLRSPMRIERVGSKPYKRNISDECGKKTSPPRSPLEGSARAGLRRDLVVDPKVPTGLWECVRLQLVHVRGLRMGPHGPQARRSLPRLRPRQQCHRRGRARIQATRGRRLMEVDQPRTEASQSCQRPSRAVTSLLVDMRADHSIAHGYTDRRMT